MNFFQYLAIAAISSSGLFIGRFIASHTKEELKDGIKYFRTLSAFIVLVVLVTALTLFFKPILSLALSFFLLFFSLTLPKEIKIYSITALLAISFWLTVKNYEFYFVPSLILLYGISEGSTYYYIENKKISKTAINSIMFLIIASILFFFNITT